MKAEHKVAIARVGRSCMQARCSCGWKGPLRRTALSNEDPKAKAARDALAHQKAATA